jgi:hypothetical protein
VTPGQYTVESWNNKDGVLLNAAGEFVNITKSDLDEKCKGKLVVGEIVDLWDDMTIHPVSRFQTDDERARIAFNRERMLAHMSEKQRELYDAENRRRALYGAKPL